MKISQLLIVLTGLVTVIVLYSFPKSIVKNNKALASANSTDSKEDSSHNDLKHAHENKVSESELLRISKLKKSYKTALSKEKKLRFADSLIEAYRRIYKFDSAAYFSESLIDHDPSVSRIVKTGDLFIEAYNFADDNEKIIFSKRAQYLYGQVLKTDTKNLEVKSKLAMTYVGSETPMQAILLLREVISADPKNQTAIYNLGILSIQSGQFDKAVGRFEELIKINPSNAAAYFYLGVSRSNLGEKEKAIMAFKKAKELDTDPEFRKTVDSYLDELTGSKTN